MVKRVLKVGLLALLAIILGEIAYLFLRPPAMRPAPDLKVEATPERLERGKYLFNVVTACVYCHSEVDRTKFGYPVVAGTEGKGRVIPGLPGTIAAANLTPDAETGAGRWSDGVVMRAVREGIGHDDRVLFPSMPYTDFAVMSDEDVYSVIAYMRTLAPIRNPLPRSEIQFPVNLMVKAAPQVVASVPAYNTADKVAMGKYYATLSGCIFCHTPVERGSPVPGREFGGGHEFNEGDYQVVSQNITPDKATGIGEWTEEQFIQKFRDYREYAANGAPPVTAENFTSMPWLLYSAYKDEDLAAIFAYLKTVPAISNAVESRPKAAAKQ